MFKSVLAALVACVFVAGCASGVAGSPISDGDADVAQPREPLTSEVAFDDIGAIDPCSLTDAAAFDDFGEAELPGAPTMDECTLTLSTDNGKATVRVGQLLPSDVLEEDRREVADLPRGAGIVQASSSSEGLCTMVLMFADDVALVATVQPETIDPVPNSALCGVAESVARRAFEIIDEGEVDYWEPGENSLARLSACELLEAEEVAAQLGITSDVVSSYPALHQCRWGRTGGDTATAKIDFPVAATPLDAGIDETSPPEVIAGRETWLGSVESGEIVVCAGYIAHGEFGLGEGLREFAALRVVIPISAGKDPCAIVRTLAASAWANLPAA